MWECALTVCVSRFLYFWRRSELRRKRQHLKVRKTVSTLETQLPTSHNEVQKNLFPRTYVEIGLDLILIAEVHSAETRKLSHCVRMLTSNMVT